MARALTWLEGKAYDTTELLIRFQVHVLYQPNVGPIEEYMTSEEFGQIPLNLTQNQIENWVKNATVRIVNTYSPNPGQLAASDVLFLLP